MRIPGDGQVDEGRRRPGSRGARSSATRMRQRRLAGAPGPGQREQPDRPSASRSRISASSAGDRSARRPWPAGRRAVERAVDERTGSGTAGRDGRAGTGAPAGRGPRRRYSPRFTRSAPAGRARVASALADCREEDLTAVPAAMIRAVRFTVGPEVSRRHGARPDRSGYPSGRAADRSRPTVSAVTSDAGRQGRPWRRRPRSNTAIIPSPVVLTTCRRRLDRRAQDRVVPTEGGLHRVREALPEAGAVFEVGEQERERPGGRDVHPTYHPRSRGTCAISSSATLRSWRR